MSTVRFGPGEFSSCFNQTIIDDSSPENVEIFELMILVNSLVMVGNQSILISRIIIIDDDIKGIMHVILYAYIILYNSFIGYLRQ